MNRALISIIIPVYNGANYIRGAIDSALMQTYGNTEVFVINDGSTDETEQVCLSYGDRIRYLFKENGGVSSALNVGVREMRGEYFTWLAHDDLFYPNKLKLQMDALSRFGDQTAIVHGNYDLLNVKYGTISPMRQEEIYSVGQLTNSVFPLLMTTLHASTPLIHKSHFRRVGMFDERLPLTQDYDFLFRAMRGKPSVFVSEPLLLSRLHDKSGKNTDNRFGEDCAAQYKQFVDRFTLEEVRGLFVSPQAFYLRMAAMMKARCAVSDWKKVLNIMKGLPPEPAGTRLSESIGTPAAGGPKNICIFGAGYYGKVLKMELEHRRFKIACFCDNNEMMHGKRIDGVICVPPRELAAQRNSLVVVIAADVSDVIEKQLEVLGFPHVTTKKKLDSLILETPPAI